MKAEEVFKKLITLYDVADELEDNGDEVQAEYIRTTLSEVEKFFLSEMKK